MKEHPEAAKDIISEDRTQFITDLKEAIEEAETARETWKSRQDRWYKKRYGIRPKKTFPWPGCSNLHLPLTDKTIRKLKPAYVGLVSGVKPVCTFEPVGPEDVPETYQHEAFFDWLLRVKMKIFKPTVALIDKMLEKGFSIAKVIWAYEGRPYTETITISELPRVLQEYINHPMTTDIDIMDILFAKLNLNREDPDDYKKVAKAVAEFRIGKDEIKIQLEDVYDSPKLLVRDARNIVVPADTTDLEKASWICDKSIWVTPNELRIAAKNGKYNSSVVEEIIEKKKGTKLNQSKTNKVADTLETVMEQKEGVYQYSDSELINLWEIYCYWAKSEKGIAQKCVFTICPDYEEPLRFIPFPYDHGEWPFVKIPFEYNNERYYSPRGIPEMIDPLQTALVVQHNQKIDRQTISNAPWIKYIPGLISPQNAKFIPGQATPVPRMDAIDVIKIPEYQFSFEREEQILKTWAEQYMGDPDFGQASQLQPITGARTKYEVQSIQSLQAQIHSLDARIFQDAMSKIYKQIWALWWQFGPDTIWTRVTGQPRPKAVTKEDIKGQFDIIPNGKVSNTNPVLEAQKALVRLQQFAGSPFINQYELHKDYLQKDDEKLSRRLLLPPEQIKKNLARMQAETTAEKQTKGQQKAKSQTITQQNVGQGGMTGGNF